MYVLLGGLVLIVGIVAAAGMIIAVLSFSSGNGAPFNINMGGDSGGSGSGGSEGGNQGKVLDNALSLKAKGT